MSDPNDYTIGWVSATSMEAIAARAFLDEVHREPRYSAARDNNRYILGRIGHHNVAIAALPDGEHGTTSAVNAAQELLYNFPNIRVALMVGIGSGAPSVTTDIRLGDVVVSYPNGGRSSVLKYDFAKAIQEQSLQIIGVLDELPAMLHMLVTSLKGTYEVHGHRLAGDVSEALMKIKDRKKYFRPPLAIDRLYRPEIVHSSVSSAGCDTLCTDDPNCLAVRPERDIDDGLAIHYGTIASSTQPMNNALIRDKLAAENGILCFETEAVGLMNHFPCLVIRGICDYADSHKNKEWQGFAAMTAAAYAKDLLRMLPPYVIGAERTEISMIQFEPAREYLPVASALTNAQRQEAEIGSMHATACRLGFLFHGMLTDTPRIIKAHGSRTSEILSRPDIGQEGADCTSIWAAATSGPASISVLLLTFMLARAWGDSSAISIWVELIKERQQQIQVQIQDNKIIHPYSAAASRETIGRRELADWDASARAWLRHADLSMRKSHTQSRLVVDNLDTAFSLDGSVFEKITSTWIRAMEIGEKLLGNLPQQALDRGVLLALSSWHLYPDLVIFQHEPRKISFEDKLFPDAGVLSLRLEYDGPLDHDAQTTPESHHAYAPTTADMTATASSAVSRGLWLSSQAQDAIDLSTIPTSVEPGGGHEGEEESLGDKESIYTSNIPTYPAYTQELAKSFFKNTEPLPDAKCMERIHEVLPDLLRGFALRIGAESQAQDHFRIMRFIHETRYEITSRFEEYYLNDKHDAEELQRRILSDMPLGERLNRWEVEPDMDDPNATSPGTPPDFDIEDGLDSDGDGDELRVDDSHLSMHQGIVTSSVAFQWLLSRVHRETSLTLSEAGTMHAIARQVRQALFYPPQNRLVSSKRGPVTCSMVFKSDWNPLAFVIEQGYVEEPDDAIEGAIVLVQGADGNTEAMPCAEYLNRTWPLLGEDFMGLVRHVVRSKPGVRCSINLFDKTTITAWIQPSGCLVLEAAGVVEAIVEVGEVYGWMTAALRSSPTEKIAVITSILEISPETNDQSFEAYFHQEYSDDSLPSVGQCWQDLFRNPVVVTGFPIQRRKSEQEPGLECSPGTLAALLRTRDITVFCGRVFIKGFCTMLVPTKYADGTVHWHVLFNEDGSRIPFTDPRIHDAVGEFDLRKHLTLSSINSARHIVGWCKDARNYAGASQANYEIFETELDKPKSQIVFDRITLSASRIISVGVAVAIGRKDKPTRATKTTDYQKQLEWAEDRFVVFYDLEDRRAWLLDGLSALLHLVRAHIAHRRKVDQKVIFTDDLIKEADTPHTGKVAARKFFNNEANMDLRIYKRWNRPVTETSIEEGQPPKSTVKRQETFEHLVDLVGDVYGILSMLSDAQEDTSTEDGFGARVRVSPRRHLQGWEFFDVATLKGTVWPKEASLLDTGLGWVDLIRSINAVTLFGVGFGELIEPGVTIQPEEGGEAHVSTTGNEDVGGVTLAANPSVMGTPCAQWTCLPTGKDLLATTTPVIRDIRHSVHRNPKAAKQTFWKVTKNLYWHIPDKIFEGCRCGDETRKCDRVQVILPTNFDFIAQGFRSPSEPLPPNGAVIFGHSWKYPLRWPLEAESAPKKAPAEQQPPPGPQPPAVAGPAHQSAYPSDSGLGTSVASSILGNDSSQASISSDGKKGGIRGFISRHFSS